jgi:hypothetical protein
MKQIKCKQGIYEYEHCGTDRQMQQKVRLCIDVSYFCLNATYFRSSLIEYVGIFITRVCRL